tara:strand:- start:753 stop:1031 length:279 start_codon:yes stop_codon:yes gene_type:complete
MFKPVNRYILVENKVHKSDTETPMGILLPDDYKVAEERYIQTAVISWAEDVRFDLNQADSIVVDNSMIEEITVNNLTYSVVQDNYIVGIIRK